MKIGTKVKANFTTIRRDFPENELGTGNGKLIPCELEFGFKYKVEWDNGHRYFYNDRHLKFPPISLENK